MNRCNPILQLPYFAFVEYSTIDQARDALQALKDYKFRGADKHLAIDFDRVRTKGS